MAEQGDFGGPSFGGDQGGQSSAGGNTSGGKDPNAGPEVDQADAISGMANALDNAANAVESGFDPSAQALGGPEVQGGLMGQVENDHDFQDHSNLTDSANISMDYGTETYGQNLNVVSPLDQKEAFMGANPSTPSVSLDSLGPNPSIGELTAAIGFDPSAAPVGVGTNQNAVEAGYGVAQGANQNAVESALDAGSGFEQETPGQEVAAFKNDFDQGILGKDPNAGPAIDATIGTDTDTFDADLANTTGATLAGAWDNPNTNLNWTDGIVAPAVSTIERDPNAGPAIDATIDASPTLGASPNVNSTGMLDSDLRAFQERQRVEGLGVPTNPNLDPLDTAQFDMDALNAHLDSRFDYGLTLDYDTPNVSTDTTIDGLAAPTTDPETTIAPKYGPKKGFVDHENMYKDHALAAAMAGVASVKSMFDGTHTGWLEAVNKDIVAKGGTLSHTLDGKAPNGIPFGEEGTNLSGKHSAADWGEYNGKFSPDKDGVPVDKDGVPMPGTDKQAQKGIGGLLQGIAYGMFSGLVSPNTSSGVVDPTANSGTAGVREGGWQDALDSDREVNVNTAASSGLAGPGGADGGEHPIDVMRSIFPWAAALPNDVLFNAARYPDYLRLLIEADASGTELPLVVPRWILDGESAPVTSTNTSTTTHTGGNSVTNHPAMQVQKPPSGWGVPTW